MSTHLKLLSQRREQLVARCALQREAMAIQKIRLMHSLESLDAGMRVLNRVRNAPGLMLALAGGLLLLKPQRRLRPLMQTALAVSRGWRLAAPVLSTLLAARRRH